MNSLIFNEVSVPFTDHMTACKGLEKFINTWIIARRNGFTKIRLPLKLGPTLYYMEIAPSYNLTRFLASDLSPHISQTISQKDLKDRFKEIITSSPFITDDNPGAKDLKERSEFRIEINGKDTTCTGLGAAWILETLCISFSSADAWRHPVIQLCHYCIHEDGKEADNNIETKNVSCPDHFLAHDNWLRERNRNLLKGNRDLWEKREEFFPNLILCGDSEKQLSQTGPRSKHLNQIIERLKRLNEFAGEYKSCKKQYSDRIMKQYGLDVTGESPSTMSKYGNSRRFRLPGGGREYFEKHIKTGDLRFHFFVNETEKRIFVGYIGPHLPIVSVK